MALTSARLANGETSAITDYNTLSADVLGHDHGTGEGGTISHKNLVDGIISGTHIGHELLNNHIQGEGLSGDPDKGGGDHGVHGLPAAAYVCGVIGDQSMVQYGEGHTDNAVLIADTDTGDADQWTNVTFPVTFGGDADDVIVIVMSNSPESVRHSVENVGTTLFTVRLGFAFEPRSRERTDTGFSWIAIGPIP